MTDQEMLKVSKLFISESNRYKEQSFLRAITDNYKNVLKFTKNTCTDGNLVEVNPTHPVIYDLKNLEETAKSMKMESILENFFIPMKFFSRGGIAHEAFHILFTDFEVLRLMAREFRSKSAFKREIMHNILNIGEDGYIELAGVNMFPGLEPYISFSNELIFNVTKTLDEVEKEVEEGKSSRLDLYLHWAMFYVISGKVKGSVTDPVVLDKIQKTKKQFSRMRKDTNAMTRYDLGKEIFSIIEDLINEAEKDNQKKNFDYQKNKEISHGEGEPIQGSTDNDFKNRPQEKEDENDSSKGSGTDSNEDDNESEGKSSGSGQSDGKSKQDDSAKDSSKDEDKSSEETGENSKGEQEGSDEEKSNGNKNDQSDSGEDSQGEQKNQTDDKSEGGSNSQKSEQTDEPVYDISDILEALKGEERDVALEEEKKEKEEIKKRKKIERDDFELTKVKYSDVNRGIRIVTTRINANPSPAEKALYEKLKNEQMPVIRAMIKQFKAMMIAKSPGPEKKLTMGTKLDVKRLADPKRRNWQRERPNMNPTDLNISLILDGSGSMAQIRRQVQRSTIVLYEVAYALNIPISIIEESAIYYSNVVQHRILVDYSNWRDPNAKYNILRFNPDEGTREGVSLKWCNAYQKLQGNKDNLMIVIADGDPQHRYANQDYSGNLAINDTHQVAKLIEKSGTNLVAISLGDFCFDSLKTIYKHTILCDEIDKLSRQLMAILKKNLFK